MLIMLQNIGTGELMFVSALLLVLFGGNKLPELSLGITESVRKFRAVFKE